jgi:hypothetical protein
VPFKIISLCAGLLAVSLGAISLIGGLHRVPLSITCASGASVCYFAAEIWPREWLKYMAWPFWIGAIVAFFLGTK